MKVANFAGVIWSCKVILQQAGKCWFGWQREGARPGRCSPATVWSKNIRNGNREMSSTVFQDVREPPSWRKYKRPSFPFFLAVNHKAWREKSTWYKLSPLGKNQIGQFLPKTAKNAGLQACGKKIANHSVRKTSISRLLDAGIPENFVQQLSGHKNLQSLSSYKSASLAHQRQMSDTLRQHPSTSQVVPVDGRSPVVYYQHQQQMQYSSSTQSTMSFDQSSLNVQAMPYQSFFASTTIGSISNCVFNIQTPSDPAGSSVNTAKRQKLDGSA